jgi:hypothetical protein
MTGGETDAGKEVVGGVIGAHEARRSKPKSSVPRVAWKSKPSTEGVGLIRQSIGPLASATWASDGRLEH